MKLTTATRKVDGVAIVDVTGRIILGEESAADREAQAGEQRPGGSAHTPGHHDREPEQPDESRRAAGREGCRHDAVERAPEPGDAGRHGEYHDFGPVGRDARRAGRDVGAARREYRAPRR